MTRLLLDTHVLLWALGAPTKLPPGVRSALEDPAVDVFVSAASLWEIAIKSALGKLRANHDAILKELEALGFVEHPVRFAHTRRIRDLPPIHRDPFDRMLVAQAIEDSFVLVSADETVRRYPIATTWQ